MTGRRHRQLEPAKAALTVALERRLGATMGVRTLLEKLAGGDAAVLATAWMLLSAVPAALVVWWVNEGWPTDPGHARIASLLAWHVIIFPILVAMTRVATMRVLDVVRRDILPFASADYAAAVGAALAKEDPPWRVRLLCYSIALLVVVASLWTLRDEFAPVWFDAPSLPLDLLLWVLMSFYYATLQMRVVITATFPRAFAAALEEDCSALYPLCALDSPLVRGLARLNRTLLLYWVIVFSAWATVLLLVLLREPFALSPQSPYLFIMVPVVAFFSVGGGALVYLQSEAAIRIALRRFSLAKAVGLQEEIVALLDRAEGGDEASAARLERLTRMHDQVIAGGRYGSRLGTTVGVLLPFVFPLIGLVKELWR